MLDQLGIKKMRRGRDARGKDTSNEATANPYKDTMPDLMTFKDGTKVKSADQWPNRRAEIVEEFEREVYGRIPKNVPKVKWEVTDVVEGDGSGVVTKTLAGHVDNRTFPKINVTIQASFTVPRYAAGRVPIILQFGGGFGFGRRGDEKPWTQQALDKCWAYGTINPGSIQPDNNRLREGIIGLCNKGQPRSPEDWGALRAWAWGVSCLIDYFEANPDSGVDPAKVCITGVSRYGKAALVATAFETRLAAGFVASSGAGGTKLFRRDFGATRADRPVRPAALFHQLRRCPGGSELGRRARQLHGGLAGRSGLPATREEGSRYVRRLPDRSDACGQYLDWRRVGLAATHRWPHQRSQFPGVLRMGRPLYHDFGD